MTTATMTLDQITEKRQALIRQSAASGKIDQKAFDELERQRAEIEANSTIMAEIDSELARIERQRQQQRLDDHLAEQVQAMDAAAEDCATAAAEVNAAIEKAHDAIRRWKDTGMALHVASGSVGHAAQQAGRVLAQKSPGTMDIHLRLELGSGENARRLQRIDAPYTAPIPR
jgi:DNA repair exonuclease SbcCD ATPase subunit